MVSGIMEVIFLETVESAIFLQKVFMYFLFSFDYFCVFFKEWIFTFCCCCLFVF